MGFECQRFNGKNGMRITGLERRKVFVGEAGIHHADPDTAYQSPALHMRSGHRELSGPGNGQASLGLEAEELGGAGRGATFGPGRTVERPERATPWQAG